MTHRPKALWAFAVIAGACLLGGCATKQASVWASHFDAADGVSQEAVSSTKIIPAPYDQLAEDANIGQEYVVVGISQFRDEKLTGDVMGAGSALEAQAMRVGADLVRVGIRPAGEETRTRYVRTRTPAAVPDQDTRTGRPVSGSAGGSMPIEVQVDVFDYLAVFYHKVQ